MKKTLFLAAIVLVTLSSFATKENTVNKLEDIKVVKWNYSCNDGTGHTGSFLASSTTSQEDALVIATKICSDRKTEGLEP